MDLYDSVTEARDKLEAFRKRYNESRPHWALRPSEKADPVVPKEVYIDEAEIIIPKWQGWAKGAKTKLDKEVEHIKLQEENSLSVDQGS
ncbi:integrase core domain-containing protein [Pseudobacteriovorax antillogorgiicola]|uniref:Integrase core domain-containing protein n=1 Tax=Pseudobacteriovorax antillogorgiicola TaxID=1513793 RepID=A0A1Y6BBB2_9BACT|nr:integrase core domain-containing protein [Pseudobacteriovorax antillogorgiicola]TCS59103.1 integrase-like protein [Pseudobacteriovorax antillogorgiicola]SME91782.1 Integrase core domain-containing protein [Pseudobacteriovorax antillogorgiicola]